MKIFRYLYFIGGNFDIVILCEFLYQVHVVICCNYITEKQFSILHLIKSM